MINALDHTCRNCGATTTGNFCHMCGQETRLHAPSLGEFLHEFIGHYVALEGRLWGSITRLLFRPGLLTTEYLAGRRKRYVEPLRLYLSLSIIFFAVLKFSDAEVVTLDSAHEPPAAVHQAAPAKAAPPSADSKLEEVMQHEAPGVFHSFDRFSKMGDREKSAVLQTGFYKYAPYAIFLLMPLFALWLKLLYLGTGKKYGEHLLFALHTNAFAFIMLGIFMFLPEGFVKFVAFCWVTGYLPWAMQRVYQKGKWGTLWRWILLGVLHGISLGVAILGVMALGIISAH
ncbi:DUF3667 domain-containing protein [Pseudoduganella violaceinigra]|uniref:DUF3667 domain-containing protein n=1 Tax=Pseudoduganella violaceinigra TaxID=246602 RepID=UPI0004265C1D|nr:DUF3667 domain-containing protein [Pseudoduganella violaceinigra]